MTETIDLIQNRRSVRAFQDKPVSRELTDQIIRAAMRAPTAGNMMLYSILEIDDQAIKDKLAKSCDDQPFIAKSPLVLLFLADYQRWMDFFAVSGVSAYCEAQGQAMRLPGAGDLMMACCDALIAAQTAVLAAESLGLGSCYIGDIIENYEYHQTLLDLPRYVFPITLVCFGYAQPAAAERALTPRFDQACIHFKNTYRRLDETTLGRMYEGREMKRYPEGIANMGQHMYARKFASDFNVEMTRSARKAIQRWTGCEPEAASDLK